MMKRLFDLVVGTALLVSTFPLFVLAAIGVALQRDGAVLFRQQRIGRHGRPFYILKFRSMRNTAPGANVTVGRDARITRFGHFLRQTKIDELPQLINVLRGEMSLVGPRPEVPEYYADFPADARAVIATVRPGITDRASIVYRNEAELLATHPDPAAYYRETLLPHKVEMAVDYVQNRSMLGDIRLLLGTVKAVVTPRDSRARDAR